MKRGIAKKSLSELEHGTRYCYKYYRCRCAPCRAAYAAYGRRYRQQRQQKKRNCVNEIQEGKTWPELVAEVISRDEESSR